MAKLAFSELMKMDKKDLNKVSKSDLIESIADASFYYNHNKEQVKQAEKKLVDQSTSETMAKKTIVGLAGLPESIDKEKVTDYHGDINHSKIDINELLGHLIKYFVEK